jgi:hypothetical protein
MKDKRIRIVAKERQVMDIGKFVLALVGIAGVPSPAAQLSLSLNDERRESARAVGKAAVHGATSPNGQRASVSEPNEVAARSTERAIERSDLQLPLPLGLDQEGEQR